MMSPTGINVLALLASLLAGGGNDLLDYLPTESYWEAKGVKVSVEAMLKEVEPAGARDVSKQLEALGSADPKAREAAEREILEAGPEALAQVRAAARSPDAEVAVRARGLVQQLSALATAASVRRLMAIRTLGELRGADALPALQALTKSPEPFEAGYALAAVARIGGKPVGRPRPVEAIRSDLWLLPESCRAVGQLAPRGGRPLGYAEALAAITPPQGGTREEVLDAVTSGVLQLAETCGNVRLDAATLGVSGDLGEKAGSVVLVARGWYDSERVKALMKSSRVVSRRVGGLDVYEPTGEVSLLMPSDEQLVLVASPVPAASPLEAVVQALQTGDGGLKRAGGMKDLLDLKHLGGGVEASPPLWVVAKMTPAFRQVALLKGFDSLTLVGRPDAHAMNFMMTASGADAEAVARSAEGIGAAAKQGVAFLKPISTVSPLIVVGVEVLESVRAKAEGGAATVTATLKTSPAAILSGPMMLLED